MIDERQEELAALAAVDLLEGAEKAAFDGEIARNPELKRRVDELRAAAAQLALTVPSAPAPAALKDRIMASAASRKQMPPAHAERPKVVPFPIILAWAIAACLALAAAGISQLYFAARTRNATLMDEQRLARLELQSLETRTAAERLILEQKLMIAQRQSDLAQMKVAALTSLLQNSPQAVAVAVWNPSKQEGLLTVDKMPEVAEGKDYELWVIPPGAKPVAAGVLQVRHGSGHMYFHAEKPVQTVAVFAVTTERKGGVSVPAGPIVLASH